MSDFDNEVLRALKVFGPCSNAEIARRLKCKLHQSYAAMGRLGTAGLVDHPKLQVFQLSELGREYFAADVQPLRVFQEEPAQ